MARGEITPAGGRWLRVVPAAPDDVAGVLEQGADGHCVFHQACGGRLPSSPGPDVHRADPNRRCAIHTHRPSSCEHFPFVCLIDARGVHVTLSHYCPTVAALLLTPDPVRVVEGPPVFPDRRVPEGLDARDSLPPVERAEPGVVSPRLMSWADVSAWEGELVARVRDGFAVPDARGLPDAAIFEHARAAVPPPLAWPEAPVDLERTWTSLVAPGWSSLTRIVGRYLAARVFASWALHLGDGTSDVEQAVTLAATVLRVEAARLCQASHRVIDAELLIEAVRQSDLLLVHYADPARLVHAARGVRTCDGR
jgi:hypothetical protein